MQPRIIDHTSPKRHNCFLTRIALFRPARPFLAALQWRSPEAIDEALTAGDADFEDAAEASLEEDPKTLGRGHALSSPIMLNTLYVSLGRSNLDVPPLCLPQGRFLRRAARLCLALIEEEQESALEFEIMSKGEYDKQPGAAVATQSLGTEQRLPAAVSCLATSSYRGGCVLTSYSRCGPDLEPGHKILAIISCFRLAVRMSNG